MPYFRVDDNFGNHPKVLAIPRRDRLACVGLWTLAGNWCSRQLTDGRLGAHMLEEFGATARHADHLVKVGLWEATEDGYAFHEWLTWQFSREEVLKKREEEAEKKRRWREKKAAERAGGDDIHTESTTGTKSSPSRSTGAAADSPDPVHSSVDNSLTCEDAPVSRGDKSGTPRGTPQGTTRSVPGGVPDLSPGESRSTNPTPPHPTPSHPVVPFGDDEDGSPKEGDAAEVDARASSEPPLCRRHIGWDRSAIPPCDACRRLREQWEANRPADAGPPPLPPLCGQCDERWIDGDDGLVRCPRCHPAALELAGTR